MQVNINASVLPAAGLRMEINGNEWKSMKFNACLGRAKPVCGGAEPPRLLWSRSFRLRMEINENQ